MDTPIYVPVARKNSRTVRIRVSTFDRLMKYVESRKIRVIATDVASVAIDQFLDKEEQVSADE